MSRRDGDRKDIDRFFALKVCINLDRRPERWAAMRDKFAALGIRTVGRLAAVDGRQVTVPERLRHLRPPEYACTMSHLAAVEHARRVGAPNVLIFEDDALFDPEFRGKFPEFIAQVPPGWDQLFLGGYHIQPPIPVSANVVRSVETLTTHAYALNASLYDAFIGLNSNPPAIVDRNNTLLQARFACYCFEPNLVGQEAGYSDINDRELPAKPLAYAMPIEGPW